MLRTFPQAQEYTIQQRLAGVAIFTILTAIAAQLEIHFGGPVPFTLQVLTVLLAGMVLGSRDGMLSQIAYLGLIWLNFPIAAGGVGAAALSGATAGYLVGFVPAAWIAGFLTERGATRTWQRWLAGIAGIMVIYLFGLPVLKATTGADWRTAWSWGVAPFITLDLIKAVIAAGMTEGGRALLLRTLMPSNAL